MRILFIRTDRIGDFLLNLPAIHALKETYPDSKISVLIHPEVQELVNNHPDIDEFISFTSWKNLFFALLKKKYDMAIISNPHKYFHLLTFLARIPQRIGYRRKWGFLLTHSIEDKKAQSLKHEVEYNLDLVSQAKAHTSSPTYHIPLSQEEETTTVLWLQRQGLDLKKPIIVINPYTTASFKQWPPHHFIELIKKFSPLPVQLVLIGGNKESFLIKQEILPHLKDQPIFDFSGLLSLKQLAVLLKKATLLISNDSGPIHIAAAFNTKTLVLFGNKNTGSNPKRWGPWKSPEAIILQALAIQNIKVKDVWTQIQKQFQSSF